MTYRYTDLVEIQRLQQMLTSLHAATGLAIVLTDTDGTTLASVGWQDICSKFHRACPRTEQRCLQRNGFLAAHLQEGSYVGYRCPNGLMEYSSPIVIEGQHVATLFSGQLLHEPPDEAFFRQQAQQFGFDPVAYMEALRRVPVVPREQSCASITFLTQLARNLASAGLERMRLLATTIALQKSQEEAQKLREDLEQRVVERTAQLAAANQELSQREASLEAEIAERERAEEALHRLNADLIRAQKRTSQVLHTLEAVSRSLELDQVLHQIASEMASAVEVSHVVIYLIAPERGLLTPRATFGNLSRDQQDALWKLPPHLVSTSLVRAALQSRKPLVSPDAQSDPLANQQLMRTLGGKSAMIVPIQRSNQLLGVALGYTTEKPHAFTAEEVGLALGIADAAALAIQNAELFEETRRRLAESESFARVMVGLVRESKLEELLDIVCSEAQQLIGASGSAVLLLEEDGWLHLNHSAGCPRPHVDRLPIEDSLAGKAIEKNEPVWVNDPSDQIDAYQTDDEVTTLLAVPLRSNGGVIGVLDIVNKPNGFSDEDVRVMGVFASQAAMAIEHARLHRRAAQLAVIEERQRLARELHDSVTQALYGVTLFANAASAASSAGKQETAAGYLRKLRETAQEAMADMRLLIFQLHPPVLEKDGLVSALQARLAAVEARAGLKTELRIEGEEQRFPIEVEEQLYWIAQEALNNVLKHAKAHRVTLRLEFKEQTASLEVSDDGIGFDASAEREHGGVGLRSIEERVARVRGRWKLESQPGEGTLVAIEVALAGAQSEAG